MASFLSALGSAGQGFVQSRMAAQQLQDRALTIQQHQQALDQAKHQLAAEAAVFNQIGAQPVPQTGQPPMPGQVSVPNRPPQPQGQPPMAAPMPGTLPQAAPQQGAGATPVGGQPQPMGPGTPDQAMGQQDPYAFIMRVAQDIKRRNPGIEPETLAMAVDRVMGLWAPQLRTQTQILTTQLRNSGEQQRAELRATTQRDIAGQRVAATERGQDVSLQRARETAGAATQRAMQIQQSIDKRFASGSGDKVRLAAQAARAREITSGLTNATRQLNSLTSALVPANDPRAKAAQDKVNEYQRKLDILDTAVSGSQPAAPTQAGQATPGGKVIDFSALPK